MDVRPLSIVADDALMTEILTLRKDTELRISDPIPTKSLSEGLRAPISPDQIIDLFQYATVIFQTGTAGIAFLTAVAGLIKRFSGSKVVVIDPKTQQKLLDIDEHTPISTIERVLG